MERPRQNSRWNTAQYLRSIEESQYGEENRQSGRSLVSRLGMSELSCFPSSRSRRASDMQHDRRPSSVTQKRPAASQLRPEVRRTGTATPAAVSSRSGGRQDRAKTRVLPRTTRSGVVIRNNNFPEVNREACVSEDHVFELELMDEASGMQTYRRKSSSARGITSDERKLREEQQRAANLRRSSTSRNLAGESLRPQKMKLSRRAAEVVNPRTSSAQVTEYHGLMNCHLEQPGLSRPSSNRRGQEVNSASAISRGGRVLPSSSRPRSGGGTGNTVPPSSSSYRFGANRSLASNSRPETNMFTRSNITNCFPALGSQGRRSSSPRQGLSTSTATSTFAAGHDLPPLSTSVQAPVLERMASVSRERGGASSSTSSDLSWPSSSFGWEYHRPRLMAEGLAKILMALERVETDEDLTHEQLLMLEATVLFGGMGYRDQHHGWRMDVDEMSYEELLALEDKMGVVNTGLDKKTISSKMFKSTYSVKSARIRHRLKVEEFDIKCSICQEEYEKNDQLGWLDCGHQYHAECIKDWLVLKNICPICKATGLSK